MAVADVYDALVDNRIYRKGMSHQEAYNIIMEGCGTQFDPVVTEIFNQCHTQFIAVAAEQQQLHKANNL
jgi:putative two-component system response regulator